MRTATVVLGLLVALAQPYRAVAQQPCSDKVEQSATARRLCREVLPGHGKVLMKDGAGGFCACRCTELDQMTYKQVRDLKAARDSSARINLRRYAKTRKPMYFGGGTNPYLVVLGEDTLPIGAHSDICAYDRMLVNAIRDIEERNVVDLDGFELGLLAAMEDGQFYPVIEPGVPGGGVEGGLTVPRRFVMDPAVRWELMLFMLLHELGHGVKYVESGKYVSEYEADMWAANVGLPAFFDDGDAQEEDELEQALAVRLAAADQLYNYFISVHTEAALPLSSVRNVQAIDYPMNAYPALQCRLDSIRWGVMLEEEPGDLSLGYPDGCWQEPQLKFPEMNELPVVKECDPDPAVRNPCEHHPEACALKAEVDSLMQEWDKLLDKCALRPDLCFKGGKFTALSQLTAKGPMSQVEVQLRQLLKDIRRARATAVRTERDLQRVKK